MNELILATTMYFLGFGQSTVYLQAEYFGEVCEPEIVNIAFVSGSQQNHLRIDVQEQTEIECSGDVKTWNSDFTYTSPPLQQVDLYVNDVLELSVSPNHFVFIPLY